MVAAVSRLESSANGLCILSLILQPIYPFLLYYVLRRYLEFNKPSLIEVKLSKKEIIGRLRQQKDDIRESRPHAHEVRCANASPLAWHVTSATQQAADEGEELSELDARLIRGFSMPQITTGFVF